MPNKDKRSMTTVYAALLENVKPLAGIDKKDRGQKKEETGKVTSIVIKPNAQNKQNIQVEDVCIAGSFLAVDSNIQVS